MSRYKPSVITLLEKEKTSIVMLGLGLNFVGHFVMALINVAIFSFVLSTFGFWYSVAVFTALRAILFIIGESTKYKMEQEIMKGGK